MTIKQIKEVIGEFQKYLNNKHHSSSGIFYIYKRLLNKMYATKIKLGK